MIEAIEPTDLPLPTGPYSHAIRAGGLIFVSGILALDEYGRTVSPGDAAAQASYIFAVLSKISRRPEAIFIMWRNLVFSLPTWPIARRSRLCGARYSGCTGHRARLCRWLA